MAKNEKKKRKINAGDIATLKHVQNQRQVEAQSRETNSDWLANDRNEIFKQLLDVFKKN